MVFIWPALTTIICPSTQGLVQIRLKRGSPAITITVCASNEFQYISLVLVLVLHRSLCSFFGTGSPIQKRELLFLTESCRSFTSKMQEHFLKAITTLDNCLYWTVRGVWQLFAEEVLTLQEMSISLWQWYGKIHCLGRLVLHHLFTETSIMALLVPSLLVESQQTQLS